MKTAAFIFLFLFGWQLNLSSQDKCYVTTVYSELYSLSAGNCSVQLIDTCDQFFFDIAITPSGLLYGVTANDLYRIDTSNASSVHIAGIGIPFLTIYNNLVALNDGFLMALRSDSVLMKIDVTNGAETILGTLPYSPGGDITYFNGYYYLAAYGNMLVKLKLNASQTTLLSHELTGTMGIGGNNMFGITAMGNFCETTKLYGFADNNLYEINAHDASTTLVCTGIYPGAAFGATSLNEAVSPHITDTVVVSNVFTPNHDGKNDTWGLNTKNATITALHIYNRWGQQVFSGKNTKGWDGNAPGGLACSEGIYYFILEYENFCGESFMETGFLHLFR